MLFLGLIARKEIRRDSAVGSAIAKLSAKRLAQNERRRKLKKG